MEKGVRVLDVAIKASPTAAFVVESWINHFPDKAKAVSPLMENHFGNIPASLAIAATVIMGWQSFVKPGLSWRKSESEMRELDAKTLKIAFGLAVAANLANEVWDTLELWLGEGKFNHEIPGDIALGVAAAGVLVLGHKLLTAKINRQK